NRNPSYYHHNRNDNNNGRLQLQNSNSGRPAAWTMQTGPFNFEHVMAEQSMLQPLLLTASAAAAAATPDHAEAIFEEEIAATSTQAPSAPAKASVPENRRKNLLRMLGSYFRLMSTLNSSFADSAQKQQQQQQ